MRSARVSSAQRLSLFCKVGVKAKPQRSCSAAHVAPSLQAAVQWKNRGTRDTCVSDPSSRYRGLFQESSKCDQSVFSWLLVAHSLLLFFFSFFFSRHGPFIVRSAQLFHRSNGFTQFVHPSRCSQPSLAIVCFCFLYCISDVCSIQQMSHLLVVQRRIHGQWKTNPANLQCCCSTESRDWLRSNICAQFRCKNLLETEFYSFLYSQNIVYQCVSSGVLLPTGPSKNLTWNCHFGFQLSLDFPDPGV